MRLSRRWAGRLAASALVLVVLALAVPYIVPLGGYIPRIERAGSAALGQPLHVETLRLHLLPRPHVTAYGVAVGNPMGAHVETLVITPKLTTLLSETRVLDDILLDKPWVSQAAFSWFARGPVARTSDKREVSPVSVTQIRVRDGTLRLAAGLVDDIDVTVALREPDTLHRIDVTQAGGLHVTLENTGREFSVVADARNWRLPVGPPLRFEKLSARGTLATGGVSLRSIDARLYRGTVAGNARLGWKGGWKLDGALAIKDMEIAPVIGLFTPASRLTGRLSAQPSFASTTPNPAALADALKLESDFEIADGVLQGMDLVAAAKAMFGSTDAKNAQTRFDELTGHLGVDELGYHFSKLAIVSGLLRAGGEISISRTRALDGEITAEVRGTASLIATPLAITGTIDEPKVRPTKAALAGAALGTAILPGIGTAIGARAGQLTKRLFGGGARKAPETAAGSR